MCYIVELLLETLGSIDISTSHEAMIYCIGALKFLTGNSTIAKQLVKIDCVERLSTSLSCINKTVSDIGDVYSKFSFGERIAQFGEHWTLYRKVSGSLLNRGAVVCLLEQDTSSPLLSTE